MVLVRRPFSHYDPVRCGMPTLYGTVSERAAKTIRFNTLWQWKGYDKQKFTVFAYLHMLKLFNFFIRYFMNSCCTTLQTHVRIQIDLVCS